VLFIFEFEEKELAEDNIAEEFFCRFRSQHTERQYHVQYRSIVVANSIFENLINSSQAQERILSGTRLIWDFSFSFVLPRLTEALLPQLRKVELLLCMQLGIIGMLRQC
jgi:hypothetical protein